MQTYFKLSNNVVKTMIWTLAKFWEDLCVITLKHTVRKTYLRNNSALMQTFSLPCFSSSNRVGGVAHDCMDFALKVFFPWLPAPFCFRSLRTELRELIYWLLWTTTTTTRPAEGSQAARRRRSIFEMSTYLIVDSTLRGGVFITNFGFLIFPSLSDYFPLGELIRTLASEK